jgi:hypothetical protein
MPMKREARDGIRSKNLDAIFFIRCGRDLLIQKKIYPIWDFYALRTMLNAWMNGIRKMT